MKVKPPPISWCTRERWTAERCPPYQFLFTLSNFATPEEIEGFIRALQQLHKNQNGSARRNITDTIKTLRDGHFPRKDTVKVPEALRVLEPLHHRHRDANALYKEAWMRHYTDRRVDDAAWQVELERRAAIEAEFAAAWEAREENAN